MKLNIRRRMRLVALSGGVLSFVGLFLILCAGFFLAQDKVTERRHLLGDSVSGFVEMFAGEQTRRRLSEHVADNAQRVEREMEHTRQDVEALAQTMSLILSHPEHYASRALPDPHEDEIASGEVYLNLSNALAAEAGDDLRRETGLAANIADTLAPLSRFYTGAFVGSRNGWLIAADSSPDGKPIRFSEKFLESYDPRVMNWYRLAAEKGTAVFTNLYVDTNGNRCLTCAAPFYDGEGFAGVVGIDCNAEEIYRQAGTRAQGGAAFASFILGPDGKILFSSRKEGMLAVGDGNRDLRQCEDKSLALEAATMTAGKSDVQLVTLDGQEVFLAYAPMESLGWSLGQTAGQSEVNYPARYARDNLRGQMRDFSDDLQNMFLRLSVGGVFLLSLLLGCVLWIGTKAADRFVRPILSVTKGVKEIAQGNLDKKLDIRTGDEIELLADSVNAMTVDLKAYMENLARATADKERIATELSVACKIQAGMLPSVVPDFSGQKAFELDASMTPAKEVGGDFYDFYMLDEHRLAVTIADVSGKGVPAALFMVAAKNVLQNLALAAKPADDFAAVMARANNRLCEGNDQMMFVTVFFGVLDLRTGAFSYVNAGHNPPLVARRGGEVSYLLPEGKPDKPMGVMEGLAYHQNRLTLAPGDMVFLYTDGVTESTNETNELYGEARLQDTLARAAGSASVKDALAAVNAAVNAHAGNAEQADDFTTLGLRYLGA
ncbi:MAG: SpoIIE family protein phosphatase [Schwartzia sp.]|nr:SpoIIE family protein phosphatase [Schwartzia sp. (in: firmicutes)]